MSVLENICLSDIYFDRTIVIFRIRARYVFMKLFSLFPLGIFGEVRGVVGFLNQSACFVIFFLNYSRTNLPFSKSVTCITSLCRCAKNCIAHDET